MTVRLIETLKPPKDKESTKYRLELCKKDQSYVKVFENLSTEKGLLKALRSAQSASSSIIMASAFIACGIPVTVDGASTQTEK